MRLSTSWRKMEMTTSRRAHRKLWRSPPKQTVSQWADANLKLSPEDSAEPGQYSSDRAPYQRGILDAFSDPKIERVVVKSSAQVGKTLIAKAVLGYYIHQDPAPILVIQPTVEMAETFSKDRLAPMIRDTPVLKGKIADPRSRDSGNTTLHKRFPGGHLTLAGANSPAGLASRPIRIVLFDEVDRFPPSAGTEGDPVALGEKRTSTFWNRKKGLFSTPTKAGISRIERAFLESDQRSYHVPCPHCSHFHVLIWDNVRYPEGHPEAARMACPECGVLFGDADKPRMLRLGQWVAAQPTRKTAGFYLNELYSPWRKFADVAADYESAKDKPELLKTWWNTSLGLPYEEPSEAPEWQRLYDKREKYPSNRVPLEVGILTAGVDVQGDRLELEIVGWAPGKRSYQIDYRVLLGDTSKVGSDGPWAELAKIIHTEQWDHESGAMLPLRTVAIDSGYRTTTVYDFCRQFHPTRVAPIKGRDDQATVISNPKTIDRRRDGRPIKGIKLFNVGSSVIKQEFYGWLRLDLAEDGTAPPGYCHFNEDRDQQWFKELTSERIQVKLVRGFPREVWIKNPNLRNEPLDCRVYARAAAAIAGIDRWRDREWQAIASQHGVVAKPKTGPAKTDQEDRETGAKERQDSQHQPSTNPNPSPDPRTRPVRLPRKKSRTGFWE